MLCFGDAKPRVVGGIAVGALAGTMLWCAAGIAVADPAQPGCTAADLARVSGTVATETAAYLSAHPEVNDFFTTLKSKSQNEVRHEVEAFMDAHPQAHTDLQRIRQPREDLENKCQWSGDALPE